ncbi:MAG: hypothetical protein Roseis2KO_47850 [Roseivirga sp.]
MKSDSLPDVKSSSKGVLQIPMSYENTVFSLWFSSKFDGNMYLPYLFFNRKKGDDRLSFDKLTIKSLMEDKDKTFYLRRKGIGVIDKKKKKRRNSNTR